MTKIPPNFALYCKAVGFFGGVILLAEIAIQNDVPHIWITIGTLMLIGVVGPLVFLDFGKKKKK
jgi:hypothetical protein